jgi:hypothetical protein
VEILDGMWIKLWDEHIFIDILLVDS